MRFNFVQNACEKPLHSEFLPGSPKIIAYRRCSWRHIDSRYFFAFPEVSQDPAGGVG